MTNTQTKKRALACRVSNETFDAVRALTEGDTPPYETTSEYLYTLVISDLGRRSAYANATSAPDNDVTRIKAALKNPEVQEIIRSIVRD